MATKRTPQTGKRAKKTTTPIETVVPPVESTTEPVLAAAETEVPTDEIRKRAYSYWAQGNPDALANWFRAENELKAH